MIEINKNLKKIIPSSVSEYNIGLNKKLGESGLEIFKWLDKNNKINPTHSYKDVTYRWSFGISGAESIQYVLSNLPQDLSEIFMFDIINYLGILDFDVNEIKFEKIGPNEHLKDIHLKRTRFGDLISTKEDNLPSDYEKTIFYSSLWHTDKFFSLDNYKILVYLNDVSENQGGLIISEPIISPKWINNKAVLIDEGISIKSDEITFREVVGPVGTTTSFNSHVLHRANLPQNKYRFCMHLSFRLKEQKYTHHKYSNNHFK